MLAAWQQGYSGLNTIIAVIDSGIDLDSPEFTGRIHADSRDVTDGGRTAEAEDDHGTNVAMIAAAARDDNGIVGIAFDATVLALRADSPGSCAMNGEEEDGCTFSDSAIAAGVRQAIESGAKVINISLGGGGVSFVLSSAISDAADAGIVIVVSAGNDGESEEEGIDPDNPDPFARDIAFWGGENVIIAGSVDEDGSFSAFSNRAGFFNRSKFLSARGGRTCCTYEDGELFIETDENGDRFVYLFSGTSFAAPQISGAVALLAQAFPNLTGAEIVELLLDTAQDAGDPGTDTIYGTGILDIAAAFAPQGATSLGDTERVLLSGDDSAVASPAMGDALGGASLPVVLTDKYDRAYNYDLGSRLNAAPSRRRLFSTVTNNSRNMGATKGAARINFTIGERGYRNFADRMQLSYQEAEQARVIAANVAMRIAPNSDIAFGISQSAQGLTGQLRGHSSAAFMIAGSATQDSGFITGQRNAMAFRSRISDWGFAGADGATSGILKDWWLTLSAEQGEAWDAGFQQNLLNEQNEQKRNVRRFGAALDRRFDISAAGLGGRLETAFGAVWLQEDDSILGARFHDALATQGAETVFLDAKARMHFGNDWQIGAEVRQGYTHAMRGVVVGNGSDFVSRAWSFDIGRSNLFMGGDRLGLRVSQPLRVESGGLNLTLPIAYDYTTESAIYGARSLSLSPTGREMIGELAWHGRLLSGSASASLFYREQPGHSANSPDDAGVAIRWSKEF